MSYIPVNLQLSKIQKNKLITGKGIKLTQNQLNKGGRVLLHPLNYQKLKDKNLNNFMMTQGELLATAENNNMNGSGIFSDIGNWLSNNASTIFDTIGDITSIIPGIGPIASTIGRETARMITGKSI